MAPWVGKVPLTCRLRAFNAYGKTGPLGLAIPNSSRTARQESRQPPGCEQCAATQTPERSVYRREAYLEKLVVLEQVAPSQGPDRPTSAPLGHVTLEDVKKAVEKLKAAGAKVSTNTVHAEIGRGSKTTICKYYAALNLSAEASTPVVPTPLSPGLLAEIAKEVDRVVRARTSQLADELEDAQKSLAAVVSESESYRAAAAEAESRAAALHLSLAEQAGVAEELRARGKSLSNQIAEIMGEAERVRQSLAISEERLRLSEERVARVETDNERSRLELADARGDCAKLREQLDVKSRECLSFQLEVETGRQAAANLEKAARENAVLQSDLAEARGRFASSEAQRQGLGERLKDAQAALSRAELTCEQLLQKVLKEKTNGTEDPQDLPAGKPRRQATAD
jgi:DNA repair exonuclease SbcCD ATPase subunit